MKPINIPIRPIKLSGKKQILEKDIEGRGSVDCRKLAVMFEKFTSPGRRSVPDRMLTFTYGLIAFIEYKAPGNYPTDKQWADHQKRRVRGVLVYVIDDIESGKWLINKLIQLDQGEDNGWHIRNEAIDNRNFYVNKKSVTRIPEHSD